MPATCVLQYVPGANTGLSKHGDPVFPHFWSWNQNLARVCARGGRGRGDVANAEFALRSCDLRQKRRPNHLRLGDSLP